MKYILLNRNSVVVDILDTIRYIKLLQPNNIVVACPEAQGTGVIGSDGNTHYILSKCDISGNPNAVSVLEIENIPEGLMAGYAYLDKEMGILVQSSENLLESPEQKIIADIDAMIIDQEYRLTLLEMGTTMEM